MHRINLNKNLERLDLICDVNNSNVTKKIKKDNITIERTIVNNSNYRSYNKKKGEYVSIRFDDVTDYQIKEKIIDILSFELKRIVENKKLIKKPVLVVGLGNNDSTPDSLGPKTLKNIITTRHISVVANLDDNFTVVSKIAPSVFANTGIETYDILKGIIKRIRPTYIIVIDALSSKNLNNLNKVIQITDSGIEPGSGVGNNRKELSKKTLGVEVISIGVPTVVNLHTIVKDILNEYDLNKVLSNKKENYMVTPKEIDFVIEQFSIVLSKAINNMLHKVTK